MRNWEIKMRRGLSRWLKIAVPQIKLGPFPLLSPFRAELQIHGLIFGEFH